MFRREELPTGVREQRTEDAVYSSEVVDRRRRENVDEIRYRSVGVVFRRGNHPRVSGGVYRKGLVRRPEIREELLVLLDPLYRVNQLLVCVQDEFTGLGQSIRAVDASYPSVVRERPEGSVNGRTRHRKTLFERSNRFLRLVPEGLQEADTVHRTGEESGRFV